MSTLMKKSSLLAVLDAYAAKKVLQPSTRSTYGVALRVLTKVTPLRTVADFDTVKPGVVQDAFDEAIELGTYSRKTLSMAFSLGKSLRDFLRLRELVEKNPFDAVRVRIGNNVPEANVLQPGEVEKVLNWLVPGARRRPGSDLRLSMPFILCWRAVFLMLVRHGLRIHELANLKVSDLALDEKTRTIITFRGKGKKLARMLVQRDAMEALQTWRRRVKKQEGIHAIDCDLDVDCTCGGGQSPSKWLCPGNLLGHKLSRITAANVIGYITEQALGHRVTPHGLRATFISQVIGDRGIEAARKLARHSSLSTTQRYSRWEILDTEE